MRYRVLWIDDDCEKEISDNFIDEAEIEDIYLDAVKSARRGIEKLKSEDLDFYDAVIIDGLTFMEEDQQSGTEDSLALQSVIRELRTLEGKRKIPFFVYTAQAERLPTENLELQELTKYVKGRDQQAMFDNIKAAAAEKEIVRIKQKYEHVFALVEEGLLEKSLESLLFKVLKGVEDVNSENDCELLYNPIRKIIEGVFLACNKSGLLHDECIDAKGHPNLTYSSLFLSGIKVKLEDKEICSRIAPFPYHISRTVQDILNITNEESHLEQEKMEAKDKMASYRKYIDTPYLFKGLVYRMLDVLEWFRNYNKENSDIEINKACWEVVDKNDNQHEGIIEKDERENYHCGDSLISYSLYSRLGLSVGDKIKVDKEKENTGTTNGIYSKFVCSARKID